MIPYGRQDISQTDIDAVVEVLQSDFLTQGPVVPKFEAAVADSSRAKHAVAFNSATSALHLACLSLGLGAGDILWTTPNTFVASANCGIYCGARVDFVDIDENTWNLSVEALRKKLEQAKQENLLPKVLVSVHFSGQATEQEAIWALANDYGFRVIEDASHAIGAHRSGEPVGSCRWSDITIFSFHPVKIVTSGEGGMALTNDAELSWKMGNLRSHGITRDSDRMQNKPLGKWYYEQVELGFNYRMTDIHAALGLSQLGRLEEFVAKRNYLASRYNKCLEGLPLKVPTISDGNYSAYHLYVVRIPARKEEIFESLRQKSIGVNLHYYPVHLQPYYRNLGFKEGMFPEAERYSAEAITLPLYPGLTEEDQDIVVKLLSDVI